MNLQTFALLSIKYVGIFYFNYNFFNICEGFSNKKELKYKYLSTYPIFLFICGMFNLNSSMILYLIMMVALVVIFMNKKLIPMIGIMVGIVVFYTIESFIIVIFIVATNINLYLLPSYHFYNVFASVLSVLINILVSILFNHIILRFKGESFINIKSYKSSKFSFVVLVNSATGALLIYISGVFVKTVKPNENAFVIIVFLIYMLYIISNVLMAYVYRDYLKTQLEDQKKHQEAKIINKYAKDTDEMLDTLRSYKHDIVNIISGARLYVANGDIKEIEKYFDENILAISDDCEKFMERAELFNNIKVDPLRSLLASKIVIAESKGIQVNVEIRDEIFQVLMETLDLNRVLGILIDNAIEGANVLDLEGEKTEKYIRLAIILENKTVSFIIMNNCYQKVPDIYMMKKKGYSTKGENRGLGLYNVTQIVNRYSNVTFDMEVNNNEVITSIHIKN